MHPIRTGIAVDRRHRGHRLVIDAPALAAAAPPSSLQRDIKLFAATFAGGFLFVSIFFA